MDLSSTYLGFRLKHPLMPGASPLADDLDKVKRLEDCGASAIVLRSLFEEQILNEQFREVQDVDAAEYTFPEALTYFPRVEEYRLSGIDRYLEQVRKIKETVDIPVIASLNGITSGGWIDQAQKLQEAGADALELNIYYLATDPEDSGEAVEKRTIRIVQTIKETTSLPFAVKLSPFYSSIPNLVKNLEQTGAWGVVLFNRFYQPDIDPEELEVVPHLKLSDSSELLLRLRWTAILSGKVGLSLAISGGVHTAQDAIKSVMSGAHAVQMVSALLKNGPGYLGTVYKEMQEWLERHEYESLEQMQGNMNLLRTSDPGAFERANYVQILQGGVKYV